VLAYFRAHLAPVPSLMRPRVGYCEMWITSRTSG
jgi:hypothetical protein